jgi:hypothetical protein
MNTPGGTTNARPLLAIAASAVLIVSFFLPWVTWGSFSGSLASSFSREMATGQGGLTYFLLVGGAATAAIASVLRAAGGASRGLVLSTAAGFACSLGGFGLFMIDWNNYAGALTYSGYSIGIGVWLGAVAALVGLIVALADQASPGYGATAQQSWSPSPLPPQPQQATNWQSPALVQALQPAGAWNAGGVGRISYVEAGRPNSLVVRPGQQVMIGRVVTAGVRLSDPKVSREHATITFSGGIWLVRDLGATNPTRLLDASGSAQTVNGEIRIASGQLLIGEGLVTLFPAGS